MFREGNYGKKLWVGGGRVENRLDWFALSLLGFTVV